MQTLQVDCLGRRMQKSKIWEVIAHSNHENLQFVAENSRYFRRLGREVEKTREIVRK